ncbi:AAA family ATPase [Actinomadura sp. KC216]|uniref:DNA repair ATPase n=1 Tax=Actinomadura sp. KC216 TaxID=2530370 RepID=UPI001050A16C|nr:DNA repair ATPase [Actinomadura sp. KC216]TDB85997.1 AAA family ATPase [Actinomadura sp. KC216]
MPSTPSRTEAPPVRETSVSENVSAGAELDHGTYEVLRARLAEHAGELARRAEALNARRLEVFGGAELRPAGTERIRTAHSCVPRDVVALGDVLLTGYNVLLGRKPETAVEDVFSLHRRTRGENGIAFAQAGADAVPGLLDDPRFQRDFADIHRYYRQARLLQLRLVDGRLLAVFQTGPRLSDLRVLRWRTFPDGRVAYEDNQGYRDHAFPPPHDVDWIETTRDDHVPGRHPHISIGGEVFVATIGGTLTVKIEDDTGTGAGIHSEPVDEPLQSLADADVLYARVGALILLRIRPYNETAWRHLVFNVRTKDVVRLDGIAQACRRLPDDHGIIFPGGYHLDTGAAKTFDTDVRGLEYERAVRSPNGEDVLYVFHSREDGRSLLLPYNVIRKQVTAPITCHGYSLFEDGTLVVLRGLSGEPTRVHPLQLWATPFASDAYAAAQPVGSGPLERIGNPDLVRGVSECLSVARMVDEMSPSTPVFEALIAACTRASDLYPWLAAGDLGDLAAPLADVRATAGQVLDEYEKVRALTGRAEASVAEAADAVATLIRRSRAEVPGSADAWITRLSGFRRAQGRLETLRDLRYADTARIDELSASVLAELGNAGQAAVEFLQHADAFTGYHAEVGRITEAAGAIETAADAAPLADLLDAQNEGLEIVTEVVGDLDITDATARTAILERVGEVLGGLNRARAVLDNRRRDLLAREGRAAFAAELALLDQSIAGALATAATPEDCDERLGHLLLRLETLQARFADLDDFLSELETKRTEVYEAFSSRKQTLLDERARRTDRLTESADRILSGVRRRAAGLASPDEVAAYFATDAMVARLRAIADELRALDDGVRAEELDGRIKAARQEAGRALRDRLDLYGDDGGTIRLGRHRFAVNTRPIELTLVPHRDALAFAITGTGYRAPVRDEAFAATRHLWNQALVSETPETYRAEYLATSILAEKAPDVLHRAATDGRLLALVQETAADRYDEGYERGVHDHDAARILETLLRLHTDAGLLRYPGPARATAQLFWAFGTEPADRAAWTTRARSLVRARRTFGHSAALPDLTAELTTSITGFAERTRLAGRDAPLAAGYLIEELATSPDGFVTSQAARDLLKSFGQKHRTALDDDLRALGDGDLAARHQLAEAWLHSFGENGDDIPEAVATVLCPVTRYDSPAALTATIDGLLGNHARIADRRLDLRLDELLTRTHRFRTERVPAFRAYQKQRNDLIAAEERRLGIAGLKPRTMSAFVRNRLVDEVYLPLIGDNLAKQLGAAGDGKRTDHMGLLLLISPPGYGKTTLMEYVADRLGLALVKVDGPALGHDVTSLDPAKAPNATAAREVEKINFALDMGDNVMLYVDDIQHTSPEFLQKFIPLCDAQRRIDGAARTYDLRGKRFAVCMAGNPYTESGRRFRIPDMLANRADVWNLGDVLSGKDDLFALSYIENALTSNPVLAPLTTHDRGDVELLVRLASGDETVRPDRLSHPYSQTELDEILSVLEKLLHVQQVVLTVNRAYMASAAQDDSARTEPPFRLQGSYRDMNKLAERVLPVMNAAELEAAIDDHYKAESQTLTSDAEANLLKLSDLRGTLTPPQAERWTQIKTAYQRSRTLAGDAGDPSVGALLHLADKLSAIEAALRGGRWPQPDPREAPEKLDDLRG